MSRHLLTLQVQGHQPRIINSSVVGRVGRGDITISDYGVGFAGRVYSFAHSSHHPSSLLLTNESMSTRYVSASGGSLFSHYFSASDGWHLRTIRGVAILTPGECEVLGQEYDEKIVIDRTVDPGGYVSASSHLSSHINNPSDNVILTYN
jgi:hypothetical protein